MFIFAIENNKNVYAYNERNQQVLNEPGTLYQYTDSTVAIKRAESIYVYGLDGKILATYPKDLGSVSNITGIAM